MLRWLRNIPLVVRSLIVTVVAVVAVLALFAFLGSDALDTSTERIREMELRYAGLAAESVDSALGSYYRVLAAQSKVLATGPIEPERTRAAFSHLLETEMFPGGVFLLDADGSTRAAEPALTAAEEAAIRGSSAVRIAMAAGTHRAGEFFQGSDGSLRVPLVEPVRRPDGTVVGWLGGFIDPEGFPVGDLGKILAEEPGSRAMIVDSAGTALAPDSNGVLSLGPAPYYAEIEPRISRGVPQILSLAKAEIGTGDNVVAVIAPLNGGSWNVVIQQPESAVYSLLRLLRWQFVYYGALIMLLALVSAWSNNWLVLEPLRELLRATRRLIAGDLTAPIRSTGRDEIAELSREFETMRLKMADWSGALSAAVERQTHRLFTLYAIDRVASKTLSLEEVLDVTLERVLELMQMDAGAILFAEGGGLRLKIQRGAPSGLAEALSRVDLAQAAVGTAAVEKKVVVSAAEELPAGPLAESIRAAGLRTLAVTPLIAKDRALGVLAMFTRAERSFAVDDVDLLESIGQQIGSAVHNARLFESEQRRRAQAEGLYELGADTISLVDLQETARVVCSRVAKAVRAQSAIVTLIDPNGQILLRLGADPRGTATLEPPMRPHGLTMRVFLDGRPLTIPKPDAEQELISPQLAAAGVQSMVGLPLRAAGRILGTLFVRFPRAREFSEEEVRELTTFANTAAMALERVRLTQETRRRLEEVGALYELSSVLRGTVRLDEMLPLLLHQALQMARADAASISLVEGREIVCRAAEGLAPEVLGRRVPLGEGLIGGAAAGGEVRQTPFLPRDPLLVPPSGSVAVVRGVGCTVCQPLRTADEVVGVLLLVSYNRSQFAENELRLLGAAADIAGGSIHRAVLFEQLEHRVHELGSLYEFGQSVSTSLRLEDVVRLIADSAPPAVHAQAIWVFLWDPAEERLVLQNTLAGGEDAPAEVKYRAGEGLVGWVFLEGRPALVPDVDADPRWKPEPDHEQRTLAGRARDALAVPMIHGKKVLGVLLAINHQPRGHFSAADRSLFAALAGQTAISIENAMLFEDVRSISVATISSLATAIDARDPYTRGHSEDVTRIVVHLARALGWQGADLEMIEFAALLHDVGKIAVPDDILRKPMDLAAEEWNVIYLHPYHSAQILRPVEPLRKIIPWIYHHHERWDGEGYPDRLKGEAIPEGARIIAVVDAFNAITTNRPYHKALTEQEALDEIIRNAGKQFDPKIVEAFVRIVKAGV
jgi:putative nucleotidyltransferase with HDIG domain